MFDRLVIVIEEKLSLSAVALLLVIQVFVTALLVVLWHTDVLPIVSVGTFVFFVVLAVLCALYRPLWVWWFFVGSLPLEAVNLAPTTLGVDVRPYQLLGAALVLALVVRAVSGRAVRRMFRWRWWDMAVVVFVMSGFVAALFAEDVRAALLQAVIVASFGVWFFVARYFVRGPVTARTPLVFFFASTSVAIVYGLWQVAALARGTAAAAVMAARPNATFSEPDWLGVYLVFVIALLYGVLFVWRRAGRRYMETPFAYSAAYILLVGAFALLLVSVARSAWVGAVCVVLVCVGHSMTRRDWRAVRVLLTTTIAVFVVAYGLVVAVPFTTFDLLGRVQSTGSGLQEITVACESAAHARALEARGRIDDVAQLADFACRHINLEDVDAAHARGEIVAHVDRPDPSHGARKDVYTQVFVLLRSEWRAALVGVGWGQADLGTDAQGARLNTSNLFLEVWLGAGLLGLGVFVALVGSIVWRALRALCAADTPRSVQRYGFFALVGLVAIVVPNFFNAGILLGFVWVFLGMMAGLRRV